MNSPGTNIHLGGGIDSRVNVSGMAYETYVWLGHSVFHPDSYREVLEVFHDEPADIVSEYERWTEKMRYDPAYFVGRLEFILYAARQEIGTANRPVSESGAVNRTQQYLLGQVGVFGMRLAQKAEYISKDPTIKTLENPFKNHDLLEALWLHQSDRRLKAELHKLGTMPTLLPGYWQRKTTNK